MLYSPFSVGKQRGDDPWIILQHAKRSVAEHAEQAPYSLGGVISVDSKTQDTILIMACFWLTADSARPSLGGEHGFV